MKTGNRIRVGVIGTNFIADKVISAARLDLRFDLSAVCSRTAARAAEFAARHDIPHTFTRLEEMLESGCIDALYIATPNYIHATQAKAAMERGIHVLCEKPMASNAREATEMAQLAHEKGVTLMEAMKPTLTPCFEAVRQHLEEIGQPRRYFSAYCQYSSRYDALKAGTVLNAFKPELSNGAMMDIGIYTIYPMVVLFGKPDSIHANGFKLHTGVDAQGSVSMSYPGMTADVVYSKISDSFLPTEIQGEEGTITIDRINAIGKVTLRKRGKKDVTDITPCGLTDDYFYEVRHFFDLIEQGAVESPVNSHGNSITTLQIIDETRRQLGVVYPAD